MDGAVDLMLRKKQKLAGTAIQLDGIDAGHFDTIARRTDGMSGRGLSKLMISIQGHVYAKSVAALDGPELLEGAHHTAPLWSRASHGTLVLRCTISAARMAVMIPLGAAPQSWTRSWRATPRWPTSSLAAP